MALLGKRFQNAVGGGLVGLSALTSSAMAQTGTDSLPNTPITTLAVAANTNEGRGGQTRNVSLTARTNEAAREGRLTRSERNQMARAMDIAEEGTTSFGFLMDDNSNGEGFYRIQLDFKNSHVPSSVIEDEIARFRDDSIIFVSPYSSEDHIRAEVVEYMNRDGKSHDPHHPDVEEYTKQLLKESNDSRLFIRNFALDTARRSDTNVVLIELSQGVFEDEYNRFVNANNVHGPEGTPAEITSGIGTLLQYGYLMTPGNNKLVGFCLSAEGDSLQEQGTSVVKRLGSYLNEYDNSFTDLVAADNANKPTLALNQD